MGGSSFHGGSLANYLASTSLAVSQLSCLSLPAQTGGDLLVCCWLAIQLASLLAKPDLAQQPDQRCPLYTRRTDITEREHQFRKVLPLAELTGQSRLHVPQTNALWGCSRDDRVYCMSLMGPGGDFAFAISRHWRENRSRNLQTLVVMSNR